MDFLVSQHLATMEVVVCIYVINMSSSVHVSYMEMFIKAYSVALAVRLIVCLCECIVVCHAIISLRFSSSFMYREVCLSYLSCRTNRLQLT